MRFEEKRMNFFKSLFGAKKESMRVEDCLVRQINSFSRKRLYISWLTDKTTLKECLSVTEGEDQLRYISKWFEWTTILKKSIEMDLEDNVRWIIGNNIIPGSYYSALYKACEEKNFKYIRMLTPFVEKYDFVSAVSSFFDHNPNIDDIREILDISLQSGLRVNFSSMIRDMVDQKRFDIVDLIIDYEKKR